MNPFEALQGVVKPNLEDAFGKSLASLIVLSAINETGVRVNELSEEEYDKLVTAICSDPRVQSLWGLSGCQSCLSRWREVFNKS